MAFSEKHCVPCHKDMPALGKIEVLALLTQVPGWDYVEETSEIGREFLFEDYKTTWDFISKINAIAEQENHHPMITFGWGYAYVTLHTHAIKGLHENDFIVAAKINQLAEAAK